MRLAASEEAVEFIRSRGGRAFVWFDGELCVTTDPPPSAVEFERSKREGYELHLDRSLPPTDELRVSVRRWPRRRLRAHASGSGWPEPSGLFWRAHAAADHLGDHEGGGGAAA